MELSATPTRLPIKKACFMQAFLLPAPNPGAALGLIPKIPLDFAAFCIRLRTNKNISDI